MHHPQLFTEKLEKEEAQHSSSDGKRCECNPASRVWRLCWELSALPHCRCDTIPFVSSHTMWSSKKMLCLKTRQGADWMGWKYKKSKKGGKNNHARAPPGGLYWLGATDRSPGCGWEHPGMLVRLPELQPAEHHQLLCGLTSSCWYRCGATGNSLRYHN